MGAAASLTRTGESAAVQALRPDGRAAQTVAAACSRAAERGRLWMGLSAAMAASTRTRRTGLEALAGWAVGSGAAFVVKGLVGRRRPGLGGAFGSAPSSSSMPSSHTAGAFAYATAAGLHTPAVGVVAAPAALAVAWSRAATGRHFPTDVVAGAAIGIVTGAAVHLVLRRRDRREGDPGD